MLNAVCTAADTVLAESTLEPLDNQIADHYNPNIEQMFDIFDDLKLRIALCGGMNMEQTREGLRWGVSLDDIMTSVLIDSQQAAGYKLAVNDRGSRCPMAAWVVGVCPVCGGDLVCMSYDGGQEYKIVWHCWGTIGTSPTCHYRAEPVC